MNMRTAGKLTFKPLVINTWTDFETLFGAKGACGGCWYMTWRLRAKDYEESKGLGNKNILYKLVKNTEPLGIIAYQNNEPIGWCSVSPKSELERIRYSRILRTNDTTSVWSIVCFFIIKEFRLTGASQQLLKAAIDYAIHNGASVIESYPVKPRKQMPDVFAYTGINSIYQKIGFKKVQLNKARRLVMRLSVSDLI